MAFLDSVEIEESLEFASNFVATVTGVYGSTVELTGEVLELSSSNYVGSVQGVYSNTLEIEEALLDSTVPTNMTPAIQVRGIFTKSIEINKITLPLSVGDTGLQFVYEAVNNNNAVPTPSVGGYEILYPVVPIHVINAVLNQTDSVLWKKLQLPSNKTFDIVRYRIRRATYDLMIDFFESNMTDQVELFTPSLFPFGLNYSRSYVRIINYTSVFLESENLFRVDVHFQFVEGIA